MIIFNHIILCGSLINLDFALIVVIIYYFILYGSLTGFILFLCSYTFTLFLSELTIFTFLV